SRQLETLLRLCQQNIPATVQQAALQNDIPELPRLWAFMQLSDLAVTKRLSGRQLKKAAKDIAEFIFSMRGSMEGEHAVQQGQRSMNFMMPMYLGENEKSYPAYIHVYDETQEDKETGIPKKETWLRLCVLTENLGAVELTCRVYEHEHLDMRIIFANQEASQEFRSYVPELRRSMRGSKLKLEDVAIGAPGV
ncbi:MAG: flagellar hook-length control protein FliK, partial [Selenomonas sp.]